MKDGLPELMGVEAMRALIEGTFDPAWVLDVDLRLVVFNQSFSRMMHDGFGLEPVMGETLDALPEPHRTRHRRLYERVLRKGAMRLDWSTPDRKRVFDVGVHRIQVDDITRGLAVYCRDVTEQRRAVALLERAKDAAEQASRAKSDFIAAVSHELRTPLNAILGFTELLDGSELSGPQRAHLEVVQTNADALLYLVGDLLDVARIEAGQVRLSPRPVDLADRIARLVATLRPRAEARGLTLEIATAPHFPSSVMADAQRVRQVLANLIENAVKYTEAGGVEVNVDHIDEEVVVDVSDTGVGINEAHQSRIFERFGRERRLPGVSGTGLGLTITQQLVHQMGGVVELTSTVDVGSRFRVRLPLEVVRDTPSPKSEARKLRRGLRLLVVDDAPENRLVTTTLLAQRGHAPKSADSGAAALERVARTEFDLVLMDVHMPGMDGLEATRRLRAAGHSMPIVALTAHATAEVEAACLAAGMSGFLTKPVRAADLDVAIRTFCGPVRVLVVDDAAEVRMLARLWLQAAGAEVVEAGSLGELDALDGRIDLALLDHELPDGTGPEAMAKVHARCGPVSVIAISATPWEELQDGWQTDAKLTKPLRMDSLLGTAQQLLRERFADDG